MNFQYQYTFFKYFNIQILKVSIFIFSKVYNCQYRSSCRNMSFTHKKIISLQEFFLANRRAKAACLQYKIEYSLRAHHTMRPQSVEKVLLGLFRDYSFCLKCLQHFRAAKAEKNQNLGVLFRFHRACR